MIHPSSWSFAHGHRMCLLLSMSHVLRYCSVLQSVVAAHRHRHVPPPCPASSILTYICVLQGLVDVLHLATYFGAPRLVALAEAALAALLRAEPSPDFGELARSRSHTAQVA